MWAAVLFAWSNRRFLWAMKDLPALIHEAEEALGPGKGEEKELRVINTFYDALILAEKASQREFVDEARARTAASWLIKGTVEMFNAFGLWKENQ